MDKIFDRSLFQPSLEVYWPWAIVFFFFLILGLFALFYWRRKSEKVKPFFPDQTVSVMEEEEDDQEELKPGEILISDKEGERVIETRNIVRIINKKNGFIFYSLDPETREIFINDYRDCAEVLYYQVFADVDEKKDMWMRQTVTDTEVSFEIHVHSAYDV